MSNFPIVVIVGRTNVGKSTLFNRLSEKVKSIIFDQDGVTRDFIRDNVSWQGRTFALIDTGGVSLRKTQDQILSQVREQALQLVQDADVVIFMCDASVGLLPEDREIAKVLQKLGKKVLLVINKADTKAAKDNLYEFERLGFNLQFPISALQGTSINDVLEAIVGNLPYRPMDKLEEEEKKSGFDVVILGKPNVGKSSLMNLLLNQERSIVADMPGTTREPVASNVAFYKEDIQVTDTAGIRKKRSVHESLEKTMVKTSFKALGRADIVLLVIDEADDILTDQELKLLFYAFQERHKAVIVLFNKQDLVQEFEKERMKFSVEKYQYLFDKLVTLSISCKSGKNIGRVLPTIQKVWERHSQQFTDDELTFCLQQSLIHKPLYRSGHLLRLFRVKQIKNAPITLMITVNEAKWFGPSQLTYLENVLRKEYDLLGVPVVFMVRKRIGRGR